MSGPLPHRRSLVGVAGSPRTRHSGASRNPDARSADQKLDPGFRRGDDRLQQTCGLLAAARIRVRLVSLSPHQHEGMARRKAQILWLRIRCRMRRAPSGAPIAAFPAPGPAFRFGRREPKARQRNAQVVSQLLAGTPSGPGGSPDAARVPCCDKARRRHASSRLTTPHENAPSEGRGECNVRED